MVKKSVKKYDTGFTSGALLLNEATAVIENINDIESFMSGEEGVDLNTIPTNSESSKKRLKSELEKRIRAIGDSSLISMYLGLNEQNRKLVLFYAACKMYPLISDFMIMKVLKKWHALDMKVSSEDFLNFLYEKSGAHPELQEITDNTRYKLAQVMMKMLKDLGLLKNGELTEISFELSAVDAIVSNGDIWFLEVVLMAKNEINNLLK